MGRNVREHRVLRWATFVALSAFLALPVQSAEITVGRACTLADAINAANNDDDSEGRCPPGGAGADGLVLTADVILTEPYIFRTGLPPVASEITIEGRGFVVKRDLAAKEPFRIFGVLSAGSLTLNDVTVMGGAAFDRDGGAIVGEASGDVRSVIRLNRAQLVGNSATRGGGIASDGIVIVTDSSLSEQIALGAAGIFIHGGGTLTVKRSQFAGNVGASPTETLAGAIWASEATLTVTDSEFLNNEGGGAGGIVSSSSTTFVEGSLFVGNEGFPAGALEGVNGTVEIVYSSFSGNSGAQGPGGPLNFNANMRIANSTVAGNFGGSFAAGVSSWAGTLTLEDSIVADNRITDSTGLVANCGGPIEGAGNFDDDATCAGSAAIIPGVDFDTVLGDNGGPTLTHALFEDSVARDAAGDCGSPLDQRGFQRTDGACDAGAFEYGAVACLSCEAGTLLVGLLSELRLDRSCKSATCDDTAGLTPLEYLLSLPTPEPGDGHYYLGS